MYNHSKFITSLALCLILVACGKERPVATPAVLQARLATTSAANTALFHQLIARMIARLDAEVAAGRPPRIDMLLLSGGAEWGAFGAGFLHAWSKIPAGDPRAMPEFTFVTGISTGALIAPYALLGTQKNLAQVDELYRCSQPAYAERRLWSFISDRRGLYDITELERVIRADLESTIIPALQAMPDKNRSAVIATTDMDLGVLHLWDVRKEANVSAERLFQVERAAIAIPGAFDPVELDESLHADGGVLMQFIAVADPQAIASTLVAWNAAHPQTPAQVRQWIIINNKPHEPMATIQPDWSDSLPRSMSLMIKAGVIGPLTSLTFQADILRRQGIDIEVRWIAIPPDLAIDPNLPPFDGRITVPLSDLGRREGASQTAWQTAPPRFIGRASGDATLQPAQKP